MDAQCYCDYEPATVYDRRTITASKSKHVCYECARGIDVGESYERVAMLYDGHWTIAKTCSNCLDVRDYITDHAPCFCWLHGSMLDDAVETLRSYACESVGFWIGGMKRVLRAKRRARIG